MNLFAARTRLVLAAVLVSAAGTVFAQAKPRIERAADLPRFAYRIDGKVEDVVRSADTFAPFAAAFRRDAESVLAGYDIADKATQRTLLGLLARLDVLEGRYDSAIERVERIRALQDKPADKVFSSTLLRATAVSAKANGPSGEAYARGVAEALQRALAPLPYALIENDVKGLNGFAGRMGEALLLGQAREVLQPIAAQSGSISSDLAPEIVYARYNLVALLPIKATLLSTWGGYLAAHKVEKADIWAARDVVLRPDEVRAPVAVAVWDSGVDTRLYPGQVQLDGNAPAVIAFDKYSRPATGELMTLPPAQQARSAQLMARTKGFSDVQSAIDSPEATEVQAYLSNLTAEQYRPATEELRMTGQYAHGTHVAGITLAGNPGARLVVARIEFVYTLKPDPCPSDALAERDARASQAYVDYLRAQNVRVVNMSWGGGVADIESDLERCGIGATSDERKAVARRYFETQKSALTKAFASAPEILFVAAAGNSNNDASFVEYVPSGIVLPNLLTVGAVDSAGEEAPFTSYGPTVKVHANGYQVPSYLPGGSRVALSGTSMSSPQVANLAAKLLAVNPALRPDDLVRIIVGTADRSTDGRRNLVNPKKAIAAARAGPA